jgi:hypothetical protein
MTNLQTSKDDFVFEKEIGEGSFSRVTHHDLKKRFTKQYTNLQERNLQQK